MNKKNPDINEKLKDLERQLKDINSELKELKQYCQALEIHYGAVEWNCEICCGTQIIYNMKDGTVKGFRKLKQVCVGVFVDSAIKND